MNFLSGKLKVILTVSIIILFIALNQNTANAQRTKTSQKAGEQRKAEKGLKDNRYFIYFLDSTITNFGTDQEKKKFKEACQRDIISHLLYMKYLFKESYSEIRKTQKILIDLYQICLKKDLDMAKNLLNEAAPKSLLSNNVKATAYIRLGYREQKSAEIFLNMGDNYKETLYSLRLYQYLKAMKNAKHSKRYGLLATVESRIPAGEKSETEQLDFYQFNEKLQKISTPEKKDYYSLIHIDNYYRIKGELSIYEAVWEKSDLHEVEDYKKYLSDDD